MSGTHIQLRYHIPSVLSERISKEFIANVCIKSEMFILVSFCRYSAYNICICSSIISDWLSIEGNQETQKPYIVIYILTKQHCNAIQIVLYQVTNYLLFTILYLVYRIWSFTQSIEVHTEYRGSHWKGSCRIC